MRIHFSKTSQLGLVKKNTGVEASEIAQTFGFLDTQFARSCPLPMEQMKSDRFPCNRTHTI